MKSPRNRYSFTSMLLSLLTLACICPSCICGGGSEPPPVVAPQPNQSSETKPLAPPTSASSESQISFCPNRNEDKLRGFVSASKSLEVLINTAVEDLNEVWGKQLPNYHKPNGPIPYTCETVSQVSKNAECPLLLNGASYCEYDNTIYYDTDFLNKLLADGDFIPVVVMAHEWGHAIQVQMKQGTDERKTILKELEADCLAGLYTKNTKKLENGDFEEAAKTLYFSGDRLDWNDPKAHGRPEQRMERFTTGKVIGEIDKCWNYEIPGLPSDEQVPATNIPIPIATWTPTNTPEPAATWTPTFTPEPAVTWTPTFPAATVSAEATDHFELGQAAFDAGNFEEAINEYQKAIDLDPQNIAAHYNRALCYRNLGQYEQALVGYSKVLELDSTFEDTYLQRGWANHNLGKYEAALDDFNNALKFDPQDDQYNYYGRGLTFYMLGKVDRSVADYNKVIQIDPNDAWAYNARGVAYDAQQSTQQSISDFTKAIELQPDFTLAYRNRGSVYQRVNYNSKAIADYKKALELTTDPDIISFVKEQLKALESSDIPATDTPMPSTNTPKPPKPTSTDTPVPNQSLAPTKGKARVYLQNLYNGEYNIDFGDGSGGIVVAPGAENFYKELQPGVYNPGLSLPGGGAANVDLNLGPNQSWVILVDESAQVRVGQIYP